MWCNLDKLQRDGSLYHVQCFPLQIYGREEGCTESKKFHPNPTEENKVVNFAIDFLTLNCRLL